MSEDPHALKLYIDGSAIDNPGGSGGIACFVEFPESWNRPDEKVFSDGFHETTNNRMELQACLRALEYVRDVVSAMDIDRVQIVTDSLYIFNNQKMPAAWRRNGWKTNAGRPVENSDLWKRFLTLRTARKVRTDIIWRKGKKSPILKSVDRAAKDAGKAPTKPDRGFRQGKVGRSKISGGASSPYPAKGQEGIVRIYRSALLRKTDHKVYFDVFDVQSNKFVDKCTAYAPAAIAAELHRGHTYQVRFNSDPEYPQIVEIFGVLPTP